MKKEEDKPSIFTVEYGAEHIAAMQALEKGEADSRQQKLILQWLIVNLCATYDMSYRPTEDGRRDTDFLEGRRFVGLKIVTLIKINLLKFKEDKRGRGKLKF